MSLIDKERKRIKKDKCKTAMEVTICGNQLVLDSLQIAEYLKKPHEKLIQKIETCLDIIRKFHTLKESDFFIRNTRNNIENGVITKSYLLTEEGCAFLYEKLNAYDSYLFRDYRINFEKWKEGISTMEKDIINLSPKEDYIKEHELTVIKYGDKLVVDSRKVAEMIDKRHDHLLRDIDSYIKVLNQNPKLGSDNFFIESTYITGTGKSYKCYLLTKKGCDMVANKMTGQKGILFTATYIDKFYEMEEQIKNQVPEVSPLELLVKQAQALLDQDKRLRLLEEVSEDNNKKLNNIKKIISLSLDSDDWKESIRRLIDEIYNNSDLEYGEIYTKIYKAMYKRYSINLNIRQTKLIKKLGKTRDKVSKLEVISRNKRLKEVFTSILKELAFTYDIETDNLNKNIA